jgi:subtilisin family serine protease
MEVGKMRRSLSQAQVEEHQRVTLSLEALEPRVMLSAETVSALAVSPAWFATVPGVYVPGSLLEQYGTTQVNWQGQTVDAVKDHWVVQFTADAVQGISSVADTAGLLAGGLPFQVVQGLGMTGQVLIRTAGVSADAVESWLSASPNVAHFSPDAIAELAAVPNDPYLVQLWGLDNIGQYAGIAGDDIDAVRAWNLSTGSSSIVAAVLDTGVDYTHPDLAANMWVNTLEAAGTPGVDDDGNGFIDDIYGYDFYNDDGDPMDDMGHGTHVAGTIGAVGNNGIGVVGVNWDVSIMALKFLNATGNGTVDDAVAAINYATMMRNEYVDGSGDGTPGANVRVINASYRWVPYTFEATEYAAIGAFGTAGGLFVAAAGNESIDNDATPAYPASYDLPNLIAVAATTSRDQLASFSNYGRTTVDLGAPGEYIMSTMPGNSYGLIAGTSMAAPHVTGVAALAWALNPTATMEQVRDAILAGAEPVPALKGITVTGGRLNAYATLQRIAYDDPTFVEVGAWASGGTEVTLYDTSGLLNVMPTDVEVKFGSGSVSSVKIVGGGDGLGLAITGASSVGSIKDSRHSEPLSFIASDGTIKSLSTKWGFTGANLNGATLGHSGGLTLAADIDGDGLTSDWNAIYSGGALLKTKVSAPIEGDVYVGGTDSKGVSISSFSAPRLDGDIYAHGNAQKVSIDSGTLYDATFGSLGSLSIGGSFGGNLMVSGAVGSATIQGSVVGSHIRAGSLFGKLDVKGAFTNAVMLGPAIGNVDIKGNVSGSYVLAGADLGDDWAVGGAGTDADTYMPGSIQRFESKGAVSGTVVAAGAMPAFGSLGAGVATKSFLFGSYMGRAEVWGATTTSYIGSYQVKSAGFVRIVDPVDPRPNQWTFQYNRSYGSCFWII